MPIAIKEFIKEIEPELAFIKPRKLMADYVCDQIIFVGNNCATPFLTRYEIDHAAFPSGDIEKFDRSSLLEKARRRADLLMRMDQNP